MECRARWGDRTATCWFCVAIALASMCGCASFRDSSQAVADSGDDEQPDFWESLSLKNSKARFKKMIGQGPNENLAQQAYNDGMALFRQQKYRESAAKFDVAYDRWPDSPLEEDALFMAGESYFFADMYPKADDRYASVIQKYPSTQYLDRIVHRRFKVAEFWQSGKEHWPITPNLTDKSRPLFDSHGHAIRVYERIRLDDPTGPLADDSIMKTAVTHLSKHRYDDADYYFTLLRNEYPKSDHQYMAHVLGLEAKLMRYQGADYDGTPLKEADELSKQILTQFSTELGEDREQVAQLRGQIRAESARRDLVRGDYYHNGKYFGASRRYYERIIHDYPETQLAENARTRIQEAQGQPDVPDSKLQWLVELFPETRRESAAIAAQPGSMNR